MNCKEFGHYTVFNTKQCDKPIYRAGYCLEHFNRRMDFLVREIKSHERRVEELGKELYDMQIAAKVPA
jgi:hypothetical protein